MRAYGFKMKITQVKLIFISRSHHDLDPKIIILKIKIMVISGNGKP